MAKRKKIDLEKIPDTLEKIVAIMDREVENLAAKPSLSTEEAKVLIAYQTALTSTYRDYRADVKAIKEELKGKTKEELQQLIKAEAN